MLCLQTALDHHGLGPRISSLQIARPRGVRPPSIDHARVQVFTMGEAVYLAGVQEQVVSGTPGRVFSVSKTVADCFGTEAGSGSTRPSMDSGRSSGRSGPRLSRSCTALRSLGSIP